MNEIQMLVVAPTYQSLGSTGFNTIRKLLSGRKYDTLRPGDPVLVKHVCAPADEDTDHEQARERLIVRAIAIADFDTIMREHGADNHLHASEDIYDLDRRIAHFYGGDTSGKFCAIYFF